jgi:hypothetical protein
MGMEKHICTAENADKFRNWLQTRGGILVWSSANLSNPGASWSTPALTAEGKAYPKPTWEAANNPRLITDPGEVVVSIDREVKRFHIAVRRGSQGLTLKVTDSGTCRIRAAVERAGKGAYYMFDYETQDAVIKAPVSQQPISEYIAQKKQIVS